MLGAQDEQPAKKEDVNTIEKMRETGKKLFESLSPSIAEVEYYLLPDENGERPEMRVGYICSNCNNMHYNSADELFESQKPLRIPAYAVAPNAFISADASIKNDWLKSVDIVFDGKKYPAKVTGIYPDRGSVRIETANPVPGLKPLVFSKDAKAVFGISNARENGVMMNVIRKFEASKIERISESGRDFLTVPANLIIADENANVRFISMKDKVEVTEKYDTPIDEWTFVPFDTIAKNEAEFDKFIKDNIYPVELRLTRQKKSKKRDYYSERDENKNSIDGIGIHLADGKVLLIAEMNIPETARLSKITIHTPDGKTVDAKFEGAFRFFDAFIIVPEQPLPGKGIVLSKESPVVSLNEYVNSISIKPFGKTIKTNSKREKLYSFDEAFRGLLVPDVSNARESFVFNNRNELMSIPVSKKKISRNYGNTKEPIPSELVITLAKDYDPAKKPSDGVERIAWLGIEFQKLDNELARSKNVAELTDDGKSGILVSHVYAASPAEKLGLKEGDVILSIMIPESGNAFKFDEYDYGGGYEEQFPWEQLDMVPPQYFDRIPQPWPSVRNTLSKALDSIGIGSKAKINLVQDGKNVTREFVIEAAPESYDTVKKVNIPDLGITVCDLTYDVRKYFMLKPEDAMIVVSGVKGGTRGAVAGIKPYEMIVSVDGENVANVEDFKKKIEGKKQYQIGVRRLAQTRIVKIEPSAKVEKSDAPVEKPETIDVFEAVAPEE